MSKADERNDMSVDEYITSLDEALQQDTLQLKTIMQKICGEKPQLYGYGTIGFGVYKYEYTSGRKGEAHTLAFYPRKGKITVYLMDGTKRYGQQLARLGKHSTTGYCIYIKHLVDINVSILTEILKASYKNIADKAAQGPIDSILWQSTN